MRSSDTEVSVLLQEIRDFLELVFKADSDVIVADKTEKANNFINKIDSILKNPKPPQPCSLPTGFREVYECADAEFEVDYMDKTLWCNSRESGQRTCDCGRYTYTQ